MTTNTERNEVQESYDRWYREFNEYDYDLAEKIANDTLELSAKMEHNFNLVEKLNG